ncbi:MAG TPA: hypothetical protein VKV80_19955 [Streptosporangiaceae bacterium]|nr:hypothetical protein [Streptosporangiaceae bacterium]
MLPAYCRPALPSSLPVLYLMSPMTLYRSPVLEAAREYPFPGLAGYPVTVWCAADLYRSNPEWQALWPAVRRRADCAVFLDHLGGWVSRGVWAEAAELLALGRRVWWFNHGQPAARFGFGPRRGEWAGRYRRVGLGYPRPARGTIAAPLRPGQPPQPRRGALPR